MGVQRSDLIEGHLVLEEQERAGCVFLRGFPGLHPAAEEPAAWLLRRAAGQRRMLTFFVSMVVASMLVGRLMGLMSHNKTGVP